MGCGVCGDSSSAVAPEVRQQHKVRKALKNIKHSSYLSQQECKNLEQYIQSNPLPAFDSFEKITDQQPTAITIQKQPQPQPLISQKQRTLWKVLLFSENKSIFKDGIFTITPSTNNHPTLEKQFDEISRDVNRTYPTLMSQQQRNDLKIVLENIDIYYPNIGYTQGMNFFVGFFLLCGFEAEESFWMFICLSRSQNFMMILNFASEFTMVKHNIAILEEEISKRMPQVMEKMETFSISSYFYSFSWLLCYFLYSISPKCCTKIWGHIIRKGSVKFIISVALQIMHELKPMILEAKGPQQLLTLFRENSLSKIINQENIQQLIRNSVQFPIEQTAYFTENSEIGKIKNDFQYCQQLVSALQVLQ